MFQNAFTSWLSRKAESFFFYILKFKSEKLEDVIDPAVTAMWKVTFLSLLLHLHSDILCHIFMGHIFVSCKTNATIRVNKICSPSFLCMR